MLYNNWIDISERTDINKLMIYKNVRFVIADNCLNILVLNDPIDICCPNNENLIAIHEEVQKMF